MKAILSDELIDRAGIFLDAPERGHARRSDDLGKSFGEHDVKIDREADPHLHFSILTIERGEVVDLDWGYHSVQEAIDVIEGRSGWDLGYSV